MTVCVAAMCNTGAVLGASDRMLTAGDIQFEPTQIKVVQLTSSIAVMVAGDSSAQAEILQEVRRDVQERVKQDPTNWWLVKDVAELYSHYYSRVRAKRAERAILNPLGLTQNTFITQQGQMAESLVRQLATELINCSMAQVAVIIAGTDPQGTHIYTVHDATVDCYDHVGFAAIGSGRWHANSQFMFAQHHRNKPFPETLLLTYAAKKRAEVSPGVGEGTDMFTVGPELGSYVQVYRPIVDDLEKMYQATCERERKASLEADEEVNKYVQNLIDAATPKEQQVKSPDSGADASPDKEDHRDDARHEQARHVTEES